LQYIHKYFNFFIIYFYNISIVTLWHGSETLWEKLGEWLKNIINKLAFELFIIAEINKKIKDWYATWSFWW
jgi:hypothetical protein